MKVSIIGIKGIGMAHAIACERVGFEVVAVLDVDPIAEDRLNGAWENKWGGHNEVIHLPKSNPFFTTSITTFQNIKADLLIIATPTDTHIPYILKLWKLYPKILVEKPLAYTMQEILLVPEEAWARISVGHEWLAHTGMPTLLRNPFYLMQSHTHPPQEKHKKECGILWDLGVHVFAHMLYGLPVHLWSRLTISWWKISELDAHIGIGVMGGDGGGGGVLHVSYRCPEMTIVDNTPLAWYDLFVEQLLQIEANTFPCTFMLGAKVCEIVERIMYHDHLLHLSPPDREQPRE